MMIFHHTKAITAFTVLFMLMAVISLITINKLQYSSSIALAARTAVVLASTINQARTSYSKNTVSALRAHPDISVQAKYQGKKYAIPNPATFAIELGTAVSDPKNGLILHTFSNYPFASRQENSGPQDNFQIAALENLNSKNPVYERVEMIGEVNVLRHAEAIFMEQSCVDCHNYHPDSPKKDWKVDDMRGAIDISIPLSGDKGLTKTIKYAYISFIIFSLIGLAFMLITLKRAKNLSTELEKEVEKRTIVLNQLARTDPLTLIANRRHFEEFSQKTISQKQGDNWPIALLVIDLDYFKNINDTYGHDIGDACLKVAVNAVNLALRNENDFHARIGGEEFAVILQGITNIELGAVVERILTNVSNATINENPKIHFTCSIGSTLASYGSNPTLKKMMSIADQTLYQAKSNGRNQACHLDYSDT
jgi:diguanylate cyclase (GGDEF)-like protein